MEAFVFTFLVIIPILSRFVTIYLALQINSLEKSQPLKTSEIVFAFLNFKAFRMDEAYEFYLKNDDKKFNTLMKAKLISNLVGFISFILAMYFGLSVFKET